MPAAPEGGSDAPGSGERAKGQNRTKTGQRATGQMGKNWANGKSGAGRGPAAGPAVGAAVCRTVRRTICRADCGTVCRTVHPAARAGRASQKGSSLTIPEQPREAANRLLVRKDEHAELLSAHPVSVLSVS